MKLKKFFKKLKHFNNGVVKLGDFGFCKSLEKANMTKTMLGSPIYMAPEILK